MRLFSSCFGFGLSVSIIITLLKQSNSFTSFEVTFDKIMGLAIGEEEDVRKRQIASTSRRYSQLLFLSSQLDSEALPRLSSPLDGS